MTYSPQPEDVGSFVVAQVSGTIDGSFYFANSAAVSIASVPTAPGLVVAPTVSGANAIGSTWSLDSGSWVGTPAASLQRAWLRCSAPVTTVVSTIPSGCVGISGASGSTYVATSADVGQYITAVVTATNYLGSAKAVAISTTPISALPTQTVAPKVSSTTPAVGSSLSSVGGTWAGSPAPTVTRVWLRCTERITAVFTSIPASCTTIPGATGAAYVPTAADTGKYLTIWVTATNTVGTANAGAISTVIVPAPVTSAPQLTAVPKVTGTALIGSTLDSTRGTWSGLPTPTVTRVWLRCDQPVTAVFTSIPAHCAAIGGATAATYTVTSADGGKYLTIYATATNSVGTATSGAVSTAIVPIPPASTVAPTVTGSAVAGSTLTASNGTWTGTPTPTYTRTWLRCTSPIATAFSTIPSGCVAISGATGTTYVATSADVGFFLTTLVTATNTVGSAKAGAVSTSAVASLPQQTVAPRVSGTPAVGSSLSSVGGTWVGTPTPTVTRVWLRCTQPTTAGFASIPASCTTIASATGAAYVPTNADVGKYLTIFVSATNTAGTTRSGATSTGVVVMPPSSPPVLTHVPKVTGTPAVGSELSSTRGTWTGAPTPSVTRVWLRCTQPVTTVFTTIPAHCTPIPGETGATYVATAADLGRYLTIFATATNTAGTVTSGAVSTAVVE